MKELFLITLCLFTVTGCRLLSAGNTGENFPSGNNAPVVAENMKVGDLVVAKRSTGSFYEGKVEKVDSSKITVGWFDKSNPTVVDRSEVYIIPVPGTKPEAVVGDMVLTKTTATGNYWTGAEITVVEGDVYKVRAVASTVITNVSSDRIIKVSSATAADFKDRAGATDFLKEAQTHRPKVPADYRPRKGDNVVAEWSLNSWHSGRIDNISGSNVYVAWGDNSKPSAVAAEKVMPMPTGRGAEIPTDGQFVLIKPTSGARWQYSQAVFVKDSSVEVKLSDGKTRSVKPNEYILLN